MGRSRQKISVESFCEVLIATKYYHKIETTPKAELLRLVGLKVFKFSESVAIYLNFNCLDIFNNENNFNNNLRNDVFEKFTTINSICILAQKYKNIKVNKPFVVLNFQCSFPNCPANYNFTLDNDTLKVYYTSQ